jgi:hypothetical protein
MKCKFESCNTNANYGYELKKAIYCAKHKNADMRDVNNAVCQYNNCNKRAFYGIDKPINCREHKKNDEFNVVKGFCKEPGCKKKPTFGNISKKPIYCIEHKKETMYNVMKTVCQYENCKLQASYGLSWNKAMYCSNHKEKEMNDVVHKRCHEHNCNIQPSFGYKWKKPIYCITHKISDMKNVSAYICEDIDCNKTASFGQKWMKPLRCNKHRLHNDKNVTHKSCKSEFCEIIGNPKYKGYCLRCFIYTFPNETISRQFKIKEQYVVNYIRDNFANENIIVDKIINGGCSKRRPDVYIDKYTHVVVIECDENQHKQSFYSNMCENKRLMEIFQDFGSRPLIIISFNPDQYIDKNGLKHDSCFKRHRGFDVPIVKLTELENRLYKLKELIQHSISIIPKKEITKHHMFYDEVNIN